MAERQYYSMNFGPQHPASHGVLRLVLTMEGEIVREASPHIGLLHRGTEKLAEARPYIQNIGYMDRLDYVSMMCNEHVYVMAIEKLLGVEVPVRAQYIRVMFDEITRILSHLIWLGAAALDVGNISIFLYCFQAREMLFDCYEAVSGARMHAQYYRPGGVQRDLPEKMPRYSRQPWHTDAEFTHMNSGRDGSLLDFIDHFVRIFPEKIALYTSLLSDNRIFKQRMVGIGVVSAADALAWGFSGPMLRASGVAWDLRKDMPYSVYDALSFDVPIGTSGDCYDRYVVRMEEMRQSLRLIAQCSAWLKEHPGPVMSDDSRCAPPDKHLMKTDMEAMIRHFKFYSEGMSLPLGQVYTAIEHPKGEMGVYLVSDGANKPYRLKIRAAGFTHLSALNKMVQGHLLSDVVAILSSLDIVFGEVDR